MIRFHNGLNTHIKICFIRLLVIFFKKKIVDLKQLRRELKVRIKQFLTKYNKMVIMKYEKKELQRRKSLKSDMLFGTEEAFSVLEEIVPK
jgi:hypothetical protein